eukprot:s3094_g1.t1
MQDDGVKAAMLEGMYKVMPESQKGYVNREQPNANERDLTQPEDEDSQRIKMMKQAMFELQARAMKKYFKKRESGLDTSESEAEAKETDDDQKLDFGIGEKFLQKLCLRHVRQGHHELFKDAEHARNVYKRWTQEFANIQWFAHPGEKFPCTNRGQACECEDAMFWCHKCGSGYCLQCRYDGLSCDHQIAHYSVDTDSDFLPDSIASADSCFNLKELFDNAMAESRYFGYDAGEQAAYRKDTIDDLYSRARAGDKVGGKLFMKFLNEGVEEYKRASDYSYGPANGRIPTLVEHYVTQQLHDMPVPIFRPRVMINAGKFEPLTEEEQYEMLTLYRNVLTTKSALTTGNRRIAT